MSNLWQRRCSQKMYSSFFNLNFTWHIDIALYTWGLCYFWSYIYSVWYLNQVKHFSFIFGENIQNPFFLILKYEIYSHISANSTFNFFSYLWLGTYSSAFPHASSYTNPYFFGCCLFFLNLHGKVFKCQQLYKRIP